MIEIFLTPVLFFLFFFFSKISLSFSSELFYFFFFFPLISIIFQEHDRAEEEKANAERLEQRLALLEQEIQRHNANEQKLNSEHDVFVQSLISKHQDKLDSMADKNELSTLRENMMSNHEKEKLKLHQDHAKKMEILTKEQEEEKRRHDRDFKEQNAVVEGMRVEIARLTAAVARHDEFVRDMEKKHAATLAAAVAAAEKVGQSCSLAVTAAMGGKAGDSSPPAPAAPATPATPATEGDFKLTSEQSVIQAQFKEMLVGETQRVTYIISNNNDDGTYVVGAVVKQNNAVGELASKEIASDGSGMQLVVLADSQQTFDTNASLMIGAKTIPANELTSMNTVLVSNVINFKPNTTIVLEASIHVCSKIAKILIANPDIQIRVDGHVKMGKKSRGLPDKMDQAARLSHARAKSVVAELVSLGVDSSRMKYQGFGGSRPLPKGQDDKRVEISVIGESM